MSEKVVKHFRYATIPMLCDVQNKIFCEMTNSSAFFFLFWTCGRQVSQSVPQGVPDIHQEISEGTRWPFARHTKQRPLHCRLQWSSATESHAQTHYGRHSYKKNIEVHQNAHLQHSHKRCGIIALLRCCNRCGLVEHGISRHEDVKQIQDVSNSKEFGHS